MADRSLANLWHDVTANADLSVLPVTVPLPTPRGQSLSLIIFSVIWLVITAAIILPAVIGQVDDEPVLWIFLVVFPAIGLLVLGIGIRGYATKRSLTISRTSVKFSEKTWFGRLLEWEEPRSAYDGVRHETRIVRRNKKSYTYQVIELVHPSDRRTVPLYVKRGSMVPRSQLEAYAEILEVPILGGEDGAPGRQVEDLDKTIHELAAEGRFENRFDPAKPPPKGFNISSEGVGEAARLLIHIDIPRIPWFARVAMLVFPLLFAAGALFGENYFAAIPVAAIFMFMLWVILRDMRIPRVIEITRREIFGERNSMQPGKSPASLRLDEIEELHVTRYPDGRAKNLIIASDKGHIRIGTNISAKGLEWLREYIAAAVLTA